MANILVTLDSLLDVRAGAIVQMTNSDTSVIHGLVSNGYFDRVDDHFDRLSGNPLLTKEAVEKYIDRREVDTLRLSVRTPILDMIKEIILLSEQKAEVVPDVPVSKISINIQGYPLSDAEKEMFIRTTNEAVGFAIVDVVDVPLQYMTPAYLKDNYDVFILYELDRWLNSVQSLLIKENIPTVTIFAPALMANRVPQENELSNAGLPEISPFLALEKIFTGYFELNLIDSGKFSFIANDLVKTE